MSGEVEIKNLTWEGREFLDAVRDNSSWRKIKGVAQKAGGAGLGILTMLPRS
jgi:hypothetical protein